MGNKEEELKKEIREMGNKIKELEEIIHRLQAPMEQMREFAEKYIRMIDSFIRLGLSPQENIFYGIKDDISREIIRALLHRNGMNISQITEAVRQSRGTASRRIIRERLRNLEEAGKVEKTSDKKVAVYTLSEEMVKKWSQMLGLFK
ncbi:MAG TPA: ArsR family transcriptional regulator [Thermoplasmatales archaeon]|nr:ArsR family transcriptional regulator [Thermoplasmatales archaeon]